MTAGRFRAYHLLVALPGLAIVVGVPFANRVHRLVLGLPFLLDWILACVLATSAVLAVVERLDRRARDASGDASTPPRERA